MAHGAVSVPKALLMTFIWHFIQTRTEIFITRTEFFATKLIMSTIEGKVRLAMFSKVFANSMLHGSSEEGKQQYEVV